MLRCKLNQSTFEKGLKTFTEITCEVSSGLQEDDMVLVSPHYMQVPIGNFVFSSAHFRVLAVCACACARACDGVRIMAELPSGSHSDSAEDIVGNGEWLAIDS